MKKKKEKKVVYRTHIKQGDDFIKSSQDIAKVLGGAEIVIGDHNDISQVFISKNKSLKLNNKMILEVEVSSVKEKNDKLLHSIKF